MSHDVVMFLFLYGLSCIPWLIAFQVKDRSVQWGLLLIDAAFTIASYTFLWHAIGWWILIVTLGLMGVGMIIEGVAGKAYDNLSDEGKG